MGALFPPKTNCHTENDNTHTPVWQNEFNRTPHDSYRTTTNVRRIHVSCYFRTLDLTNTTIFANMAPCGGFNTQNLHMYKHCSNGGSGEVCCISHCPWCTCYRFIHVTAPGHTRYRDARETARGDHFTVFIAKWPIRKCCTVANIRSHTLFSSQHGNCYWAQANSPLSAEPKQGVCVRLGLYVVLLPWEAPPYDVTVHKKNSISNDYATCAHFIANVQKRHDYSSSTYKDYSLALADYNST